MIEIKVDEEHYFKKMEDLEILKSFESSVKEIVLDTMCNADKIERIAEWVEYYEDNKPIY